MQQIYRKTASALQVAASVKCHLILSYFCIILKTFFSIFKQQTEYLNKQLKTS